MIKYFFYVSSSRNFGYCTNRFKFCSDLSSFKRGGLLIDFEYHFKSIDLIFLYLIKFQCFSLISNFIAKSPPKVTTFSIRHRDSAPKYLSLSELQSNLVSFLYGNLVKNGEFYVTVGIVEDRTFNDLRDSKSQGILQEYTQKVCVSIWNTSNLSFVKKVYIPNLDGNQVKSVVDLKVENGNANRLILAFNTNDSSKGNVYIIYDPFNNGKTKNLGGKNGVEEICIHNGSGISGFGFVYSSSKVYLFVATEKAIWKLDFEKKSPIKICNLRGQISTPDSLDLGIAGCKPKCADISSGEYPVFLWDEFSNSEEESKPQNDQEDEQFLIAALANKLMILNCSRITNNQGHPWIELDYHATLFSKTKLRVLWFKQYLIIHSKDSYQKHILSIYSLCGKSFRAYEYTFQRNQTIEDIETFGDRCVLLIKTIPNQTILPAEYSLFALEEKSMKRKLEILTKRFKYDHALELALSQLSKNNAPGGPNSDMLEEEISDILKKSGDYMISDGEYDKAIQRYLGEGLPGRKLNPNVIEKIRVEPSAVIKSFSEAQAIEPLTKYLVKLHEMNQADNEHTKLLLECYIRELKLAPNEDKRKEIDYNLNNFLNQSRSLAKQRPIQIIAIKTLRRAGYRNRALSQAYKEPQQDELIIQIEIEDYPVQEGKWNFKRALAHLESLKDINLAISMMEKYGSIFMQHIPQETTNVMIRLCTTGYKARKIEDKKRQFPVGEIAETMEQDLKIAKTLKGGFSIFGALEIMAQNDEKFTSGPEMNREFSNDFNLEVNPERFIKAFAGNDYWLMIFLESVVYSCKSKQRHKYPPVIYNTLLEIYLTHLSSKDAISLPTSHKVPYIQLTTTQKDKFLLLEERINDLSRSQISIGKNLSDVPDDEKSLTHQQEKIMKVIGEYDYSICLASSELGGSSFEDRIMKLLEMEDPNTLLPLYGLEHALVLVQTARFEKGILFLYAKLNLHYDILQYYESNKNYEKVVNTLEIYGQNDPNMWMKVLAYFTKELESESNKEEIELQINFLLSRIKENDILPPLIVVQALSRNKYIKIGMIKEYLKQELEKHQGIKIDCENKIKALETEIKKVSNDMMELKTRPRIFQKQKCCLDTCNKPLDLPAIHFMCQHSYHQRCLTNEEECPKCANELKAIISKYHSHNKPGENYEAFDKLFKRDGLNAVTHYFGLGIFREQSDGQNESNNEFE